MNYKQVFEKWSEFVEINESQLLAEGLDDIGLPEAIIVRIRKEYATTSEKIHTWVGNYIKRHAYLPPDETAGWNTLWRSYAGLASSIVIKLQTVYSREEPEKRDELMAIANKIMLAFERERFQWHVPYKDRDLDQTERPGHFKRTYKSMFSFFRKLLPKIMPDYYVERLLKDEYGNNIDTFLEVAKVRLLEAPLDYVLNRLIDLPQLLATDPAAFKEIVKYVRAGAAADMSVGPAALDRYARALYQALEKEDQIIHKFSDGFYWYNTKVNSCKKEQAMMHNCGSGNRSDTVLLSLRWRKPGSKKRNAHHIVLVEYSEKTNTIVQIKGKEYLSDGTVVGNTPPPKEIIDKGRMTANIWDMIVWLFDNLDIERVEEHGEHSDDPEGFEPMISYIKSSLPHISYGTLMKDAEQMVRDITESTNDSMRIFTVDADVRDQDEWDNPDNPAVVFTAQTDHLKVDMRSYLYRRYPNSPEERINSMLTQILTWEFPLRARPGPPTADDRTVPAWWSANHTNLEDLLENVIREHVLEVLTSSEWTEDENNHNISIGYSTTGRGQADPRVVFYVEVQIDPMHYVGGAAIHDYEDFCRAMEYIDNNLTEEDFDQALDEIFEKLIEEEILTVSATPDEKFQQNLLDMLKRNLKNSVVISVDGLPTVVYVDRRPARPMQTKLLTDFRSSFKGQIPSDVTPFFINNYNQILDPVAHAEYASRTLSRGLDSLEAEFSDLVIQGIEVVRRQIQNQPGLFDPCELRADPKSSAGASEEVNKDLIAAVRNMTKILFYHPPENPTEVYSTFLIQLPARTDKCEKIAFYGLAEYFDKNIGKSIDILKDYLDEQIKSEVDKIAMSEVKTYDMKSILTEWSNWQALIKRRS